MEKNFFFVYRTRFIHRVIFFSYITFLVSGVIDLAIGVVYANGISASSLSDNVNQFIYLFQRMSCYRSCIAAESKGATDFNSEKVVQAAVDQAAKVIAIAHRRLSTIH